MNVTVTDGTRTPVTIQTGSPIVVQPATGPVTSLNGETGAVTITADSISALPTSGGTITGDLTIEGVLTADGTTGWANVLAHNAIADGTTDNAPAFNAAIAAAGQGGVVIVPPGSYAFAAPIVLSLGVTLRGSGWNPHFTPRTNMTAAYLRPLGGGAFTGSQLIRIDPAPVNGSYTDSAYGGGPRVEGLALNGAGVTNSTGGTIAGIAISNAVHDAGITDVTCWKFTGDGLTITNASGIELHRVVSTTNGGTGFNFVTGATDANLSDCYSQGNGGDGYTLPNPNAVSLHNCRSEWNAGNGYTLTGLNYSSRLIGCNTDRSGQHGFNIQTLDGGHPVLLVGCEAKRDGSSGTYAGFNFLGTNSTTQCAGGILTACSAHVGRNDDSTGTRTPAYAVQTQYTRHVTIDGGGWMEGTSAAYNDLAVCLNRYSGTTQVVTDPTTGTQTVSNSDRSTINGNTGSGRSLLYYTRGSGLRWELVTNSTSEAGSNAGSDFDITRYDDTGAVIETGTFRIVRSSGAARLLRTLTLGASADGTAAALTLTTSVDGTTSTPVLLINPTSASKRAVDIRLAADTVSRLRIDESAGSGSGTLTFGNGTLADTNLYRAAADTLATDDDLAIKTIGKGLRVAEGTNAKMGTAVLNGTTAVTITTTAVTASSRIMLTINTPGGTPASPYVFTRTAGTSFQVKSTGASDTSTIAWLILEPA
jgi:hypothetical protein